jgi:hypothetical protein
MSEIHGTRRSRFERNWAVGWAGVGLGFAAAFAVAVVAFDITTRAPVPSQMAAVPTTAAPSDNPAGTETQVTQPAQLVADEGAQDKAPAKDSSRVKSPTSLQEYPSQMVGTNSP